MMVKSFGSGQQLEAIPDAIVGTALDDIDVAHRIGGKMKGPVLLVCGREPICRPVFDKIARLPSLPWLSGTLLLGYVGGIEATEPSTYDCEPLCNPSFDESLFLDFHEETGGAYARYRQIAYWAILRKMTQIGMISGRGVPMQ